jgi:hypothetical protein
MAIKRIVLLAAAFLLALWTWAATMLVCGKCGYEAAQDQSVCAHCGASLPPALSPAEPTHAAADNAAAGTNIATLALAAAREDVRLARENEARPERALALYANALALSRLIPRESIPADAGARLVDGMAACHKALARTARPCPACGGSGSRSIKLQSLAGGEESSIGAGGALVCAMCEGAGVVVSGRSADELRLALAQGRRDFELLEQAAGRVTVGRAWVPPALAAQLDLAGQVLLRTAAAAPCTACLGIGRQTCTVCRGLGRTKCRQTGCEDGWVVRKPTNTLASKNALRQRVACSACQGTGWSACATCRASGAVVCSACQGSGQPPRCNRCGGEGTVACTRCRGSGRVGEAVCDSCHGTQRVLCTTCHGEGRLSR